MLVVANVVVILMVMVIEVDVVVAVGAMVVVDVEFKVVVVIDAIVAAAAVSVVIIVFLVVILLLLVEMVVDDGARLASWWLSFVIGTFACFVTIVVFYLLAVSVWKFGRRYRSDSAGDGPRPQAVRNSSTAQGTRSAITEARARAATLIRGEPRPPIREGSALPLHSVEGSRSTSTRPTETSVNRRRRTAGRSRRCCCARCRRT